MKTRPQSLLARIIPYPCKADRQRQVWAVNPCDVRVLVRNGKAASAGVIGKAWGTV
jgi:hypothetical protein